jgi:pimeloyl-ACP methyl ester carboxylesterase
MPIIYCIPGLGVDGRIFAHLDLGDYEVRYIHWITPLLGETLGDYALRLAEQIDQSKPFILIGVSFGGMCCASLASQLHPRKTFLISSSKCGEEVPKRYQVMRYLPLYYLIPAVLFIRIAFWMRKYFGIRSIRSGRLFRDMLSKAPIDYYKRAARCVICWKSETYNPQIIHIHGTRDRVIPLSCVKPTYIIKGGSHMMVMDKAREIGEIIRKELGE